MKRMINMSTPRNSPLMLVQDRTASPELDLAKVIQARTFEESEEATDETCASSSVVTVVTTMVPSRDQMPSILRIKEPRCQDLDQSFLNLNDDELSISIT